MSKVLINKYLNELAALRKVLARVTTVSVETMKIVTAMKALPR